MAVPAVPVPIDVRTSREWEQRDEISRPWIRDLRNIARGRFPSAIQWPMIEKLDHQSPCYVNRALTGAGFRHR